MRAAPLLLLVLCLGCYDFDALERCSDGTFLICEGFESSEIVPPVWDVTQNYATVRVVSDMHHRGERALHVSTLSTDQRIQGQIQRREDLTIGPEYYARAWVYVGAPVPTESVRMLSFNSMSTSEPIAAGANEGFLWIYNDAGGMNHPTADGLPVDRWFCLELHIREAVSGAIDLSLDGQPPKHVDDDTMPAGDVPFNRVTVGLSLLALTASIPSIDAWFDEIVIDDAPIGCD